MKTRFLLGPALILLLAVSARAEGLTLSLSAGAFSAGQEAYRQIYGSSLPLSIEAWWEVKGGFGVSAGLTWLRDDGRAVAVIGDGEEYPLRFERLSVPLTLFFAPKLRGIVLRLGAGLAYHSYRERWRTADLGFEGRRVGPRVCAAAAFPVLGRLSLIGSLAYERIATGVASPSGEKVDLGGFQVLGGVALRVL